MKNLVIFGGGFVGGNVARAALDRGWCVTIADCAYRPGLDGAAWKDVDVTDRDAVETLITEVEPLAAINTAAIADIDRAERERDLARRVNVDGAQHVAEICAGHGARYVFLSSDAVFDGSAGPYTEEDKPNPLNYYGVTKAEAEKAVLAAHPGTVAVRLSLVLGFPVTSGNSFLARLEQRLRAGEVTRCPASEIRTPVDVTTLAECLLELAENDTAGVLHLGSTGSIDRYALTRQAAAMMGFAPAIIDELVLPASGESKPGRAPRHERGVISVKRAQAVLETPMLSVEETIRRAVKDGK